MLELAKLGCGRRTEHVAEPLAELLVDAQSFGAVAPRDLIATCGSGVSATVALFTLERIGVHAERVYDGSFNEWSADASRPVEYGRAA